MKKFKLLAIALVGALFMVGCGGSDDEGGSGGGGNNEPKGSVVGQWTLKSWSGTTAALPEVYAEFTAQESFTLYQRLTTVDRYERFSGRYTYSKGTIKGTYSDGAAWAAEYEVTLSADNNTMTWVSKEDALDVAVYVKASIPDYVKGTKAAGEPSMERFF